MGGESEENKSFPTKSPRQKLKEFALSFRPFSAIICVPVAKCTGPMHQEPGPKVRANLPTLARWSRESGMRSHKWQRRGGGSSLAQADGGFVMWSELLPIAALICCRSEELDLSAVELVRRCGYKNVSKGLRRLDQLCQGDFDKATTLIENLSSALDVTPDVVKQAVEQSQQELQDADERAWRDSFRPHAIIVTERVIPQPLFLSLR